MGRGEGQGQGSGDGQGQGRGDGQGQGRGEGQGEGSGGQVNETNLVVGSALGVGLAIFMCVCGLPMFFAGIALVMAFRSL